MAENELKAKVLNTTLNIMFRNGISALRVDNVAKECGISKRTLYELFSDKDNLIRKAFENHHELIRKKLEEISHKATNSLELLLQGMTIVKESRSKAGETFLLELKKQYLPAKEQRDKIDNQIIDSLSACIKLGQKEGLFSSEYDCQTISNIFVKQILDPRAYYEQYDKIGDVFKHMDVATDCFLRGTLTQKGTDFYTNFKNNLNNK